MVRHAPIHRRSGHSDIAICYGRNVRGSSPSTLVVPLSNQVTTLNHKRFKGFKMFSDGHLGKPRPTSRKNRHEVQFHCEAPGDLAGGLVVRGARCLARRVLCLADTTAQRRCGEIIPCSDLRQTSNNIIQKGLASGREQSGSVTVPGARRASGSCPAGLKATVGLWWWAANDAAPTQWRIPMSKLTDTQLIILSAASQRDDRGVELPASVKGDAARKVVAKLMRADLLEEVRAGGALPIWRRDDE